MNTIDTATEIRDGDAVGIRRCKVGDAEGRRDGRCDGVGFVMGANVGNVDGDLVGRLFTSLNE